MKRILIILTSTIVGLSACAAPAPKIKANPEKIGNLTIQAPVGWDKDIDDSYDLFTSYTYTKAEGNKGIAFIIIYVDKDTKEEISISDFDYLFSEEHDGIDIVFDQVNDDFLGDKPIRKGSGTWQTNYDGNIGDLYDLTRAAMYDADRRCITVDYMYLHDRAKDGYEDFAKTFFDGMTLTYDYQYN